jgi:hypothetical protein
MERKVEGASVNTIHETTEVVKNISVLKEALFELLQKPGDWLWLIFILLVFAGGWLVRHVSIQNLLTVAGSRERSRLQQIESYIENPEMADSGSLAVLKGLRNAFYFKVATGIYAEKAYRDRLIELHEKTSIAVSWK